MSNRLCNNKREAVTWTRSQKNRFHLIILNNKSNQLRVGANCIRDMITERYESQRRSPSVRHPIEAIELTVVLREIRGNGFFEVRFIFQRCAEPRTDQVG
uniref:Uncharacterized protein n=1 Tax=Anopheles atroparvus TaxID=41427 RepID=A0AAG5DCC4_ANOAO